MRDITHYILRMENEDFILSREEGLTQLIHFILARKISHIIERFKFLTNSLGQYACLYECEQEQFKKSHLIQVIEKPQGDSKSITYNLARRFGEQLANSTGGIFLDYCFSQSQPKCTGMEEPRFPSLSTKKL